MKEKEEAKVVRGAAKAWLMCCQTCHAEAKWGFEHGPLTLEPCNAWHMYFTHIPKTGPTESPFKLVIGGSRHGRLEIDSFSRSKKNRPILRKAKISN